ncbi:MAG: transposase family protein [Calothrix sp. FI2-JRJ7]|nr:transposase family protein [Calothrix sp. FI2-JRJ7]
MKTPQKKKKNQELSFDEKQRNKELSSERIFVEHLIRLIKVFRVAQERFRLNTHKYKQIIMIICGLVRLRIGALILPT